jgi:NADPH:quinone reductase-like Zn-dependent oxidoreductase
MKAAVYYETGGPEVFRYEDVPDPVCDATSVLIDVGAISIEGGDTLNRAGGGMTARPHVVDYQCAGVIRAVGEQVTDRQVGQRVRQRPSGCPARAYTSDGEALLPLPGTADALPTGFAFLPLAHLALQRSSQAGRLLLPWHVILS